MSDGVGGAVRVARVDPRQLHELRRRVLRDDDPNALVSDPRDDETTSLHFAGFLDGRLVVSASFFASLAPVNEQLVSMQLCFMATDVGVQGRGLGATVMYQAEDELRLLGVEQLWANGRDSALGFYRSIGWDVVEGSEHLSAETQLPHTVIYKIL